MKTSTLCEVVNGQFLNKTENYPIESITIDSRTALGSPHELFFALKGNFLDGHDFLEELHAKGTRSFVVQHDVKAIPDSNIIKVDSVIQALQHVAAYKRNIFNGTVIGITGSNGKTIVKEWLASILDPHFNLVKSPGSYNSQIGVALSVWQLSQGHQLGIFEAGISQPNEMPAIEGIIRPDIGIFTNIGTAHEENFESIEQKIKEKLKLFSNTNRLIFHAEDDRITSFVQNRFKGELTGWTFNKEQTDFLYVERTKLGIRFDLGENRFEIVTGINDDASIENLTHSIITAAILGLGQEDIQKGVNHLRSVKMRLQVIKGINDNYIIDDTYTNDFGGLTKALDFMEKQKLQKSKMLILSDFGSTLSNQQVYHDLARLILNKGITRFIGIGDQMFSNRSLFGPVSNCFKDINSFLNDFKTDEIKDQLILIKGSRSFQFERIVHRLSQKLHKTSLEIDLDSIVQNLTTYRSKLKPGTKTMVMVKALAYGAGSFEIAKILEYHKADYLAVAYTDEGKELRKKGIQIPIMVMNPAVNDGAALANYNLEPEVFNIEQIRSFLNDFRFLGKELHVHLILNTGMNRLGFDEKDISVLNKLLLTEKEINVRSIFTHLAAADEGMHDEFTLGQANKFMALTERIVTYQKERPLKHILNSSGIVSFPQYQMDMVRLGIGLYGLDPTDTIQDELVYPSTFKTTISQIRTVKEGESIGYGRMGRASKDSRIATIAVGYADGYSRRFSNGKVNVSINGQLAPTIGNICMDMSMVDVTEIDAKEGDDVILFGESPTITDLANAGETIPYEILTNVSSRVKRVFYAE